MRLSSVTVTYNPDSAKLISYLESYLDEVDFPIVWDNTPGGCDLSSLVERWSHITIVQQGENEGLGAAYNRALEMAQQQGCTHLMTMDQDSKFIHFSLFRHWAEQQQDNILHAQVGGYHSTDQEVEYPSVWCQSATIFPLAMMEKIGAFREDYFIGMIDAEIGLRALHNGYQIVQFNGVDVVHNYNEDANNDLYTFWGHKISIPSYPPFRHYYESRNRILITKEYPSDFDRYYIHRFLFARLRLILKVILFEENRFRKISAIVSGVYYGLRGKTKMYSR
jgi:rhamnosyltransferase